MLKTGGVFLQVLFAVAPGSVAFAGSNPSVAFFHGKPVPVPVAEFDLQRAGVRAFA